MTIFTTVGDALILLSPDKVLTDKTVSYEIKLDSTHSICGIRLRYNNAFAVLSNSSCRVPPRTGTIITIIGRSDGMISMIDSEEKFITLLETKEADISPLKNINYVFFSALDEKRNVFLYNCYDRLQEYEGCKWVETFPTFGQLFPIEALSKPQLDDEVVRVNVTLWAREGNAVVMFSSVKSPDQNNPVFQLTFNSENSMCSYQYLKFGQLNSMFYKQLSKKVPFNLLIIINKKGIAKVYLDGNSIFVTDKGAVDIKFVSFSALNGHSAEVFFDCPT